MSFWNPYATRNFYNAPYLYDEPYGVDFIPPPDYCGYRRRPCSDRHCTVTKKVIAREYKVTYRCSCGRRNCHYH